LADQDISKPVVIVDDVGIGCGATVMHGACITEYAIDLAVIDNLIFDVLAIKTRRLLENIILKTIKNFEAIKGWRT
jgi:hypothetical protein